MSPIVSKSFVFRASIALLFTVMIASVQLSAQISLTSPSGIPTWTAGSTQTVSWLEPGGLATYQLDYTTNNGAAWIVIGQAGNNGNGGTYQWTLPNPGAGTTIAMVRVKSFEQTGSVFDTASFLFTIGSAIPMTSPFCTNFEDGTFGGWKVNNTLDTVKLDGGNHFVQTEDQSGTSSFYNEESSYTGNWGNLVADSCGSLCFDMQYIYNGGVGAPLTMTPSIRIEGIGISAAFVVSSPITVGDGWHSYCAPLRYLNSDGTLPSNSNGHWVMVLGTVNDWNALLGNVRKVILPVDPTPYQGEQFGFDNICIHNSGGCQTLGSICGMKFNDLNGNGLRDAGEPGLPGWQIALDNPMIPVAITDSLGNYCFQNVPAGAYNVTEISQVGWQQTTPGGQGNFDISLAAGQHIDGLEFGNQRYPAGPPCDSLRATVQKNISGDCCWVLTLVHPENVSGISSIQIQALLPNEFTTGTGLGTNYQTWFTGADNTFTPSDGVIPTGVLPEFFNFCLSYVTSPQHVVVRWLDSVGGVVCADTVEMDCQTPCVGVSQDTVKCVGNAHTLSYVFTNNATYGISSVHYTVEGPAGITVAPDSTMFSPAIQPGAGSPSQLISLSGEVPGDIVRIVAKFMSPDGCCWCYDTLVAVIPTCATVCDSLSVEAHGSPNDCCYAITLTNNSNTVFSSVEFGLLSGGMYSTVLTTSTPGWGFTNIYPNNLIRLVKFPVVQGIGHGIFAGILDMCVRQYSSPAQVIEVRWIKDGIVVCRDTLRFDCVPTTTSTDSCSQIIQDTLLCLANGTFQYNFRVQNNSNMISTGYGIFPTTPGVTFSHTIVQNISILPGQVSPMDSIIISGIGEHQLLCYQTSIFTTVAPGSNIYNHCCHSDTMCLTTPACGGDIGSICGTKFNDLNGNGVQDAGEPGLPNWEISLDSPTITDVVTDSSGNYCFNNVPAGTYTVTEINQSGWQQTFPVLPGSHTIILSAGQHEGGVNFGNHQNNPPLDSCTYLCNTNFEDHQVTIAGSMRFVNQDSVPCWNTTASDHIIEVWGNNFGNVPAYSGNQFIELNAYMVGTLYQTFTSGSGGLVTIGFAHRGRVGFADSMSVSIAPANGTATILGTFYGNDSVWTLHTVQSTLLPNTSYVLSFISLPVGGTSAGGNFLDAISISCPSSVCGLKFNDLNGNGTQDAGEPGLAGWTIKLTGTTTDSTITDGSGSFCFNGLIAGSYSLSEVNQVGWHQTAPAAPGTHSVTLATGQNVSGLKFGNAADVSTGCVAPPDSMVAWWPLDETNDTTSIDLAGFNNSGIHQNGPVPVPAKVLGGLQFDGVNDYIAVPTHAELNFGTSDFSFDAWIRTTDSSGAEDLVDKREQSGAGLIGYSFFLSNGKLSLQMADGTFTSYASPLFVADGQWHHIAVTVSRTSPQGIVFYKDGIATTIGDPTLRSGSITNQSPLTIGSRSSAQGFLFKGVLDEIELFNRVLSSAEINAIFSADSSGKCKPGTSLGSLCGSKFNDLNGNGNRDAGEPGLPNWTIGLGVATIAPVLTDSLGNYCFTDIPAGTYTVSETNQAGWVETVPAAPGTYVVTLLPGQHLDGLVFGNRFSLGSICGTKFNDLNGNGVQDAGEPGLPNWEISLDSPTITDVVTDSSGNYCFNNVPAGTYTVTEINQSGWQQTFPVLPGSHTVILAAGQHEGAVNFGNHQNNPPLDSCTYLCNTNFEDHQVTIAGSMRFVNQDSVPCWQTTASDHIIEVWGNNFGNVPAYSGNQFIELNAYMVGTLYQTFTSGSGGLVTIGFAHRGRVGFADSMSVSIAPVNGTTTILGTFYGNDSVWTLHTVQSTLLPNTSYVLSFISLPVGGTSAGGNFLDAISISCPSSVCGLKFNDLNGNGTQDAGEPGLAGWTIKLTGTTTDSTITDGSGSFCFNGLIAGSYSLSEVNQVGWHQTAPAAPGTHSVTLATGQNVSGLKFGNAADVSTGCVAPPDSMVAWWPLDETNDTTSIDLAGFNNSGIQLNGTVSVPAKVLGGLQFDGVNDYVTVPTHSELNFGTSDFTFDAWIRTTDSSGAEDLVDKREQSGAGLIGYSFFLSNGKLSLQMADGAFTSYVSPVFVADGQWHHIAVTVSRTTPQGIVFYKDGIATQIGDPTLRSGSLTNQSPLTIGSRSSAQGFLFKGVLDEIELFNRVLRGDEINGIFNADSSGKCKPGASLGSLCGSKFNDLNGNGTQDAGEPGLPGWTIKLTGTTTDSTITDGSGSFCFNNLVAGLYSLSEVNQVGWHQTAPAAPGTHSITLATGQNVSGLKFGNAADVSTGCVTPPDSMVAWWPLDEINDTTSVDLAGFNNSGIRKNGPAPVPAKVLGGLRFDGINDYVEVQNHPEINFGTGDFSFDAWIRTSDTTGSKILIDKRLSGGGGVVGYSFYLFNGTLTLQMDDGVISVFGSPVFVANGTWHHIAVTVSRANVNGIKFYLDGVVTQTGNPTPRSGSLDNSGPLRIGSGSSSVINLFKGVLDEIELFNRVLSSAEINAIFSADSSGKCKPGTSLGSLCGSKFNDLNGNGNRDAGEPGLPNWTIGLGVATIAPVLTDSLGNYCFTDIPAGTYTVSETNQAGWVETVPAAPGTYVVTLLPGQHLDGLVFGNRFSLGSICGTKFNDLNGNGVQDAGELGLPNWEISLDSPTITDVLTDSSGNYCFNNVPAGTYTVTEINQSGWQQTFPVLPGSHTIILAAGQHEGGVNFGNHQNNPPLDSCTYLCNTDFEDHQVTVANSLSFVNQDSVPCWRTTASDHVIEVWGNNFNNVPAYSGNQFIELNAHMVGTLYQTFTSGSGGLVTIGFAHRGRISFADSMSVSIGPVNGTATILGTFYGNDSVWTLHTVQSTLLANTSYVLSFISLPVGGASAGGNFLDAISISCPSSICGLKFNDLNGNGVQDAGEPGLAGWKIKLTGTAMDSTITDGSGSFCFNGLIAGSYSLSEVNQVGWHQTAPAAPGTHTVTLLVGQHISGIKFGNAADVSTGCVTPPDSMVAWWPLDEVSGLASNDLARYNNAGVHRNGPVPVLAKVGVGLQFDGLNDYVQVPNHPELNFGTGDFAFDAWIRTTDSVGRKNLVDKIAAGAALVGYSFYLNNGKLGVQMADGSSTNYGSPVFVADGNWHHIAVTVSRATVNGILFYSDGVATQIGDPTLRSGSLTNQDSLLIGHQAASIRDLFKGTLDEIELFNRVLSGAEVTSIFHADTSGKCKPEPSLGSLCGSKFNDLNANGRKDPGEPGIAGWHISLNISGIPDAITDSAGNYCFAGLIAGTYSVQEVPQQDWQQTLPVLPGVYAETLAAGQHIDNLIFGNTHVGPPSDTCSLLCNTDFEDNQVVQLNDVRFIDEDSISCWHTTEPDRYIEVWGSGALGVPAYSGNQFVELNANMVGTLYQVFNSGPGGLVTIGFAHRGRDGGTNTMSVAIGPVSGAATTLGTYYGSTLAWTHYTAQYTLLPNTSYIISFISLPIGGASAAGNFLDAISIDCPSSICGLKFNDLNRNGVQDSGEPGLPNWKIRLAGTATDSTTTDGEGRFCFQNLAPGVYNVSEVMQSGWNQTKPLAPGIYTITLAHGQHIDSVVFGNALDVHTGCVTPPDSMVAWWPLDDINDSTTIDLAGFNNSGIRKNGPVSVLAKVLGGLLFDGANDYVTVPTHAELNFGTGDFSFDAWIRTTDSSGAKDLVDKRDQLNSVVTGYSFFLVNGKLSLQMADGTLTNYVSSVFIANGQWHHIAVTVSRTNHQGIIFYKDGIATQLGDPTLRSGSLTNQSPLTIGSQSAALDFVFKGALDEIELFNRVLSSAEINAIFRADSSGKCKPGASLGSLCGSKFNDLNGNGKRDAGEPGLPNWTISLGVAGIAPVLTDSLGNYCFTGIPAGTYTISEINQDGWVETVPSAPGTYVVTLLPGQHLDGYEFGNRFSLGSICGIKFNDLNGNGIQDSGETGLSNWVINLTGTATHETITDKNGEFCFTNLPHGEYLVQEVMQPGWHQTAPASPGTYALLLRVGENVGNIVFGNALNPASTCVHPPDGMVAWWPLDEIEASLVDLAGINNVGTRYNGPLSVPAKVLNGLQFDGIDDYVEVPNHPELNFGASDFSFDAWILTRANSGLVSLIDKRTNTSGYKGYAFYLVNGNLALQLADGTASSFVSTVFVADAQWHHIAITVSRTSPQGIVFYKDGVGTQSGNPTARQGSLINSSPLRIGSPSFSSIEHFTGVLDEIELFKRVLTQQEINGIYRADSSGKCKPETSVGAVGGFQFIDLNGDGVKNTGESGLPNVQMYIRGRVDLNTLTDVQGHYLFNNLPSGVYAVSHEPQSGWYNNAPLSGQISVTLAVGQTIDNLNFGSRRDSCSTGVRAWGKVGTGMDQGVNALAVLGTDLFAGGRFTTAGGTKAAHIAKWDGTQWLPLGTGTNGPVYALTTIGTDLYVGGDFTTAGGISANRIAKWDGTNWSPVEDGVDSTVYALAAIGGDLYVGGDFTNAGAVVANHIAMWNGSWSALGVGTNAQVKALRAVGVDLYVGGLFTTAGEFAANRVARWNGTWSAAGTGMPSGVLALAASGVNLYAGGYGKDIGGTAVDAIGKWDRTNWSSLGGGVNGDIYAFGLLGTDLFAGGALSTAGGLPSSRIAKWDGKAWSALGRGLDGNVRALATLGAELYAGGEFTAAGGSTAYYIAKYACSPLTQVGDDRVIKTSARGFQLEQNYPNPFNPSTQIDYSLEKAAHVSLKVYNVLGFEVATLVNTNKEAGNYSVSFNTGAGAINLPSGVYFYRLEVGSSILMKKLTLMK